MNLDEEIKGLKDENEKCYEQCEGCCSSVKENVCSCRDAIILSALEQYRAIGTVEECREAREKQIQKKPIMKPFYEDTKEEYLCCPICGDILTDRIPMDNKDFYFHCLNCGQKLDWSE